MVLRQAARSDSSGLDGYTQGAVRLAVVATIPESAFVEIGLKFAEALLDLLSTEVSQAKLLHARAVDQRCILVETLEPGMGGGVLA